MKVSIVTRRIRTGDVRPLLFSECKGSRATCFPHFSSCIHPSTHPPALPPSTFPLPASLLGVPSLSVAQLHNSRIGHSKCNANALLYSLRATVVCNQTVIASLLRTTRIRFPDELCASFKDVGPFFPSLPRPRSHEKILLAPRMHALIYTHEDRHMHHVIQLECDDVTLRLCAHARCMNLCACEVSVSASMMVSSLLCVYDGECPTVFMLVFMMVSAPICASVYDGESVSMMVSALCMPVSVCLSVMVSAPLCGKHISES